MAKNMIDVYYCIYTDAEEDVNIVVTEKSFFDNNGHIDEYSDSKNYDKIADAIVDCGAECGIEPYFLANTEVDAAEIIKKMTTKGFNMIENTELQNANT